MKADAEDVRAPGRKRARRILTAIVLIPPVAFIATTVPGVRPHPGYSFLLDGVLNNFAYAMAPLLCLIRMRGTAANRLDARLLALGLALYGGGNVFWTAFVRPLDPEPFPSGADALFLAFYPCAFASMLLMLRRRDARYTLSLWLDGLVGGLAASAFAAAAVINPIVSGLVGSWAAIATTTAYPLLDLILLLVVVSTLSLFSWRPPSGMWMLTAGLLLFVIADVAYLFSTASGTYVSGGIGDGVWVLATLMIAASPGWADKPTGVRLPTWAVLTIPVLATVSAVALLVADHAHHLHPVALGLAAATVLLALIRLIATFREATSLAQSRELALTDELTGLGNRRALYEHGPRRLSSLDPDTGVALLLLDLDRFKEVNDSLGHHAGDEMLRTVSARLKQFSRHQSDFVVRLGGDEFALLLVDVDGQQAETVADEVRDVITPPMTVDGVTVRVGASIGITCMMAGSADLPTLLRQADVAMYQAKASRTGTNIYRPERDEFASQERIRDLELLRNAIDSGGMVLHYQPKVRTRDGAVVGVEALVRWMHPDRGLIHPETFLPLVEDAGLMADLTRTVLEQALNQVMLWRGEGRVLSVAVNLSASSLVDLDLPNQVAGMLSARGIPPESLELEITEDFLMADRQRAREILGALRRHGVRVAVDDFGTGYSSLAYLKELPIDELKLDKSFVTGMMLDDRAQAIVRSTIELAHSLGLRMVAEGVEDAGTARQLAEAGCDLEQGWFYAKAMPAEQFELWWDDRVPGESTGSDPSVPAAAT